MSEQKTSCIFCKNANGTIPCYKVYEDNEVIAFLDVNPSSRGHTLVLPKEHFSSMVTCPKNLLDHVMEVAQLIAQAQIAQLGASGANVITNIGEKAGQTIPHFHVHVIPRYEKDGILLQLPTSKLNEQDVKLIVDSIQKGI